MIRADDAHRTGVKRATVLADPLELGMDPDVRAYRTRVSEVVAPWTGLGAARWEATGSLPLDVFADVGGTGAFRDRWAHGEATGLRHALALVSETSRVSSSLGLAMGLHCEVFLGALSRPRCKLHEEVRDRALDGTAVGCLASTEPEGGSDVAKVRTTAEWNGGGWRLVGAKRYVTGGSTATHAVVSAAVVDGAGRRPTLFLVPLDDPGVTRGHRFGTLGLRGCDTAALGLDLVLTDDFRLTAVGLGLVELAKGLRRERVAVCSQLVTGARDALRLSTAFVRRRPSGAGYLVDRQAVRHRLADSAAQLYAAQAMLGAVIAEIEAGHRADAETAAAKLFIARVATRVIDESLQLMGARGYTDDYPLERWWRDARLARIGGGADELLRDAVAHRLNVADPAIDAWMDVLDSAVESRIAEAGIEPVSNRAQP